jgi:hypothetical protein
LGNPAVGEAGTDEGLVFERNGSPIGLVAVTTFFTALYKRKKTMAQNPPLIAIIV